MANKKNQQTDEATDTKDLLNHIIEDKNLSEISDNIIDNFDYLIIPKREKLIRLIYDTYKTSEDTAKLLSEQQRITFADNLLIEENKNKIRKLYWLAIEAIARNFKGNAKIIDDNFDEATKEDIWECINVDLPIPQTIYITSELYWKRVYEALSNYKLATVHENKEKLCWKCLGMSEKLKKLIEEAAYEGFIKEDVLKIISPIARYIFHLSVQELRPIKEYSIKRDPNLAEFSICNYNPDDCHHIDLSIIGELYNLRYLSLEFNVKKMGADFRSRYLNFSTLDMINLASGLKRLINLKTLKIRNSRMNNKKMEILIDALKSCPIVHIDFSYCQLNDECGYELSKIFETNLQLKSINLCGNYLSEAGISSMCYAIQNFEGTLINLNLSHNPIHDIGLLFIARVLTHSEQIETLNLCGIHVSEEGCAALSAILKNPRLKFIDITGLPIGPLSADEMIKSVSSNRSLLKLNAFECNLTMDQELKLKILMERNNYLHENPYVDMEITPSKENLPDEEVTKIKNKIYLKALEINENRSKCTTEVYLKSRKSFPLISKQLTGRYPELVKEILHSTDFNIIHSKQEILTYNDMDEQEADFLQFCKLSKNSKKEYFS